MELHHQPKKNVEIILGRLLRVRDDDQAFRSPSGRNPCWYAHLVDIDVDTETGKIEVQR